MRIFVTGKHAGESRMLKRVLLQYEPGALSESSINVVRLMHRVGVGGDR